MRMRLAIVLSTHAARFEAVAFKGDFESNTARIAGHWHRPLAWGAEGLSLTSDDRKVRRHPGAGHLDFRSILGALSETGYDGWVSGEFMPVPDAGTSARRAIAHLQSLEMS